MSKTNPMYSTPIDCSQNWPSFDKNSLALPRHYQDCFSKVLIPHGLVLDRVRKLAFDYYNNLDKSKDIVLVCVLKGANQFYNDFFTELKRLIVSDVTCQKPPIILQEFIRVKSYEGTESTGKVKIIGMDTLDSFRDRNVIVIEDIIDTGRTIGSWDEFLDCDWAVFG